MDLSGKATEPEEVEDTTRYNTEHWLLGIYICMYSWYIPGAVINGY